MTLCALSLQPLDFVKGYAEALQEVHLANREELDIYRALTRCLDMAHDARQISSFAPSADIREGGMGRASAFNECAEAYRQYGETRGWESEPGLAFFISWRLDLSLGLINKASA